MRIVMLALALLAASTAGCLPHATDKAIFEKNVAEMSQPAVVMPLNQVWMSEQSYRLIDRPAQEVRQTGLGRVLMQRSDGEIVAAFVIMPYKVQPGRRVTPVLIESRRFGHSQTYGEIIFLLD